MYGFVLQQHHEIFLFLLRTQCLYNIRSQQLLLFQNIKVLWSTIVLTVHKRSEWVFSRIQFLYYLNNAKATTTVACAFRNWNIEQIVAKNTLFSSRLQEKFALLWCFFFACLLKLRPSNLSDLAVCQCFLFQILRFKGKMESYLNWNWTSFIFIDYGGDFWK